LRRAWGGGERPAGRPKRPGHCALPVATDARGRSCPFRRLSHGESPLLPDGSRRRAGRSIGTPRRPPSRDPPDGRKSQNGCCAPASDAANSKTEAALMTARRVPSDWPRSRIQAPRLQAGDRGHARPAPDSVVLGHPIAIRYQREAGIPAHPLPLPVTSDAVAAVGAPQTGRPWRVPALLRQRLIPPIARPSLMSLSWPRRALGDDDRRAEPVPEHPRQQGGSRLRGGQPPRRSRPAHSARRSQWSCRSRPQEEVLQ
jgi:hypothetical protein